MEGFIRKHCSMTATLKKDCRAPLAMTNTTSPPEECKHHSSLRGTSATRQSHPPPVLARNVSDTAISPAPRPCEERQRHGNLTLPPSLRGASATRQSHPPPVLARNVSDTAISPAPRHCEERQRHGNLTRPPSLRAKRSNLVSRKGLLHPFGVRNDGSIQESRDINRSNRNSHSFLDIIVSLKKMNLFLLSQR